MRRIGLSLILIGIIGVVIAPAQGADLTVDGGQHYLLPQANQTVELYVTGGAPVAGFDLALRIGDGTSGPRITAIDLAAGIFADNNNGQTSAPGTDWVQFPGIITETGTVVAEGLLLRLTLDATGVAEGAYGLFLDGIEMPGFGTLSSQFYDANLNVVPATFTPGQLVVVPEPAATALMAGLAALTLRRRRTL